MIVKHLKIGWDHADFEDTINAALEVAKNRDGLEYYDIKVDSKGNNCLLIFKDKAK